MDQILVVEDDPVLCPLIAKYLKKRGGYTVAMARSGAEMHQEMESNAFDLVILDLLLPDEDGIEIARQLRAKSDVGIVIISGMDDIVDRVVGLEVGADDYLTKPFDNRELLARVRSVLRRKDAGVSARDSENRGIAVFGGWHASAFNPQRALGGTAEDCERRL